MTEGWVEVEYKCSECQAIDHCHFLTGTQPAPAVNCWKCHAGRGKDTSEMLARGVGMFPPAYYAAQHPLR